MCSTSTYHISLDIEIITWKYTKKKKNDGQVNFLRGNLISDVGCPQGNWLQIFIWNPVFPLVTFIVHCEIGLNRRETCQFKCFIASFNLFKVLQGSFQNEYWHVLTFPTGKYRLLLYYPGRTFHFPRATGKWNSRPLIKIYRTRLFWCEIKQSICQFLPDRPVIFNISVVFGMHTQLMETLSNDTRVDDLDRNLFFK